MAALLTKSSATRKTPLRRGFSLYAFDIYNGGVHYEADPSKDARNLAKHGVGFAKPQAACSTRWHWRCGTMRKASTAGCLGCSERGRVLTVVYTMRGDVPRLILARKATAREKASYED